MNNFKQNYTNDYEKDYSNFYGFDNENHNEYDNHLRNKNCCVKRVEETYCCFPSYYNEEKKEDKKQEKKDDKCNCWYGTFKLCGPQKSYEDDNKGSDKYYNQHDKNECYEEKDNNQEKKSCCRNHNRCCFCGLFRNRW